MCNKCLLISPLAVYEVDHTCSLKSVTKEVYKQAEDRAKIDKGKKDTWNFSGTEYLSWAQAIKNKTTYSQNASSLHKE